jgi:hypothetical protein
LKWQQIAVRERALAVRIASRERGIGPATVGAAVDGLVRRFVKTPARAMLPLLLLFGGFGTPSMGIVRTSTIFWYDAVGPFNAYFSMQRGCQFPSLMVRRDC